MKKIILYPTITFALTLLGYRLITAYGKVQQHEFAFRIKFDHCDLVGNERYRNVIALNASHRLSRRFCMFTCCAMAVCNRDLHRATADNRNERPWPNWIVTYSANKDKLTALNTMLLLSFFALRHSRWLRVCLSIWRLAIYGHYYYYHYCCLPLCVHRRGRQQNRTLMYNVSIHSS